MTGVIRPGVTLLTMMKDEGPRLLEWLAYHRLIGAEAVVVYTNGCRDGTDAMLDRLEAMGLVRHLRNDVPEGKKPQPHALGLAETRAEIAGAAWLMAIDADEFVHVKTGDGSFAALLDACPEGTEGGGAELAGDGVERGRRLVGRPPPDAVHEGGRPRTSAGAGVSRRCSAPFRISSWASTAPR